MLPDEALDSVFARGRESECILKHGTEKPLSNYDFVFIVSPNITCDDPVQKNYYTMKNIPTICNVCCTDLSDNKEILDLIITKKKEYVSVTPSCRSVDCGDFICLRKKKIKRSRSSEGAKPNPAKRRRQEEENGGS